MLTQRFVGSGKKQEPYLFSITINTQASGAENGTTVQYPIRPMETLLSSSNTMAKVAPIIAERVFKKYPITIDWGDNSVTKLNGDADAGIACGYRIASLETLQHTYAAHGVYTITVQCHKKSLPMGFDPHNRNRISSSYLGGFTDLRTKFPPYLVSIDSPLPLVYNVTSVYAGVTLIINTDSILYAFSNCNNLTAIPKDIFTANADKLTAMNGVFSDCTGLTAIPEGLFSTNTKLTTAIQTFSHCYGLTEIPAGLFSTNTLLADVSGMFSNCVGITSIPEGLFSTNTKLEDVSGCFQFTSITSIPEGLFSTSTRLVDASHVFSNCNDLIEIPAGLLSTNTSLLNTNWMFSGCTGLTEIPAGLLSTNTSLGAVKYMFLNCTGLTAIPEGLLSTNTLLADVSGMFSNCAGITSIPEGLFSTNTRITNASDLFNGCTGITSIPEGLLSTNTLLVDVSGMFSACEGITRVPEKLFATNTQITDVSNLFSYYTKIQGSILLYSPVVKRITYMFDRTTTAKTLFIPFHDETGAETTTYKTFKASTNPTYSTDEPNAQGVLLADLNSI